MKIALGGSLSTLVSIITIAAPSHAISLGKYTFGAPSSLLPLGNGFTTSPSNVNSGVTLSNFTQGGGLTNVGFGAGNPLLSGYGIRASGWNNQATDYFTFTIAALTGKKLTINSLNLDSARVLGPTTLQIRSSLDNYANVLASTGVGTDALGVQYVTSNLALTGLTNLTTPITFRIFGTGTPFPNTNPNAKFLALDNVELMGEVKAVPTPALLPGLVGMGIVAFRKRKKAEIAE